MKTFLLWCLLAFVCWPLALAVLVLYPIVWLVLLPFRLIGFTVRTTFDLVRAIFTFPFRMMRPRRALRLGF